MLSITNNIEKGVPLGVEEGTLVGAQVHRNSGGHVRERILHGPSQRSQRSLKSNTREAIACTCQPQTQVIFWCDVLHRRKSERN